MVGKLPEDIVHNLVARGGIAAVINALPSNANAEMAAGIHEALAHPARLRMITLLRGGPLCVGHIKSVLRMTSEHVSLHLKVLRDAGLVNSRRDGVFKIYSLTPAGIRALNGVGP
jgi:ArsR family transcriptional regulator